MTSSLKSLTRNQKIELLDLLEIKEKRAKSAIGRASLLGFTQHTYATYSANWHHVKLCEKLDKFVKGEIKRLMVFMPPQHGKSELVSRRLPAYLLGINPNLKIAGCSYSATLASSFNRDVQRIIDTKEYADLFPGTFLNSSNVKTSARGSYLRNADIFETVGHKGFYKSVGVGGPLTGTPVDIGIIDDPVKDAVEAYSETYRERVWNWWTAVFRTRLHNDSQELFTMTRWHHDDLAGRILKSEGDSWEVFVLPAIKEGIPTKDDHRENGEALWPARHSAEKMRAVEKTSPTTFVSLYQQKPSLEAGDLIKIDWFGRFKMSDLPENKRVKFTCDPAYTKDEKNDRTAMISYVYSGGYWNVLDVAAVRKEFPELTGFIPDFVRRNDPSMQGLFVTEPKASGKSITQTLKSMGLNARDGKAPTTDKKARLMTQIDSWESGRIRFLEGAAWVDMAEEEIRAFPKGVTDDIIDALMIMIQQERTSGFKATAV